MHRDSSATAAVSVRRRLAPSPTGFAPAATSASTSSGVKSPSGPTSSKPRSGGALPPPASPPSSPPRLPLEAPTEAVAGVVTGAVVAAMAARACSTSRSTSDAGGAPAAASSATSARRTFSRSPSPPSFPSTETGGRSSRSCNRKLCFVAATATRSRRPPGAYDSAESPPLPLPPTSPLPRKPSPLPPRLTLNLETRAASRLRAVLSGMSSRAPSSVAFSTSHSDLPPFSVRHPTASTHSGPDQAS
mmetsp:Transcript_7656/g.23036  ORF Transcript_7656/g.23036 Transcript_7656/m.23036 type:complete len:246 (+) Transcript_7656:249-986(+)